MAKDTGIKFTKFKNNQITIGTLFTIKIFAEKLKELEKQLGYEQTLLFLSQVDYQKICDLVDTQYPDNQPELMPSRFMLIKGVRDEKLKAQGHLDVFPYDILNTENNWFSVKNLSLFLCLNSTANGLRKFTNLDNYLYSVLLEYLKHNQISYDEKLQVDYTVKENDTLSTIAEYFNLPSWRILLEINQQKLGDNWDILKPGIQLQLPNLEKNPLKEWFTNNGWENYLTDNSNGLGYQYPGKYLSLSLLDLKGNAIEKFDPPGELEVYHKNETADLIYSISLSNGEVDLLLPDGDVGLGIKGMELALGDLVGLDRIKYLEKRNQNEEIDTQGTSSIIKIIEENDSDNSF